VERLAARVNQKFKQYQWFSKVSLRFDGPMPLADKNKKYFVVKVLRCFSMPARFQGFRWFLKPATIGPPRARDLYKQEKAETT
jgi:hypothetical protein